MQLPSNHLKYCILLWYFMWLVGNRCVVYQEAARWSLGILLESCQGVLDCYKQAGIYSYDAKAEFSASLLGPYEISFIFSQIPFYFFLNSVFSVLIFLDSVFYPF